MRNVKNLVVGVVDLALLAVPFRKRVALDCTKSKSLRTGLNAALAALGILNLWIFSESNTNMND